MADSTSPQMAPVRPRRPPSQHPKFIDMVIESILAQNDRKGASLAAIKSYISDQYRTVDPNMMKSNVRKALARGLESGVIFRPKASEEAKGITGRFKVDKVKHAALNKPKKPKPPAKPKAVDKPKVKKTVAKKEVLPSKSPKKLKTPKKTSKSKALKGDKVKSSEKTTKAPKTKVNSKAEAQIKTTAKSSSTAKPKEKATTSKAAKKKPDTSKPAPTKSKATTKKAAAKPRGGKSAA